MKFEQLLEKLGDHPMFDFAMVCTLFEEKKETVRNGLSRLKRAGKILELKRGLYTFAEPYRRATLNAAYIANMLYAPSYLSERWALSWYSVIPEKLHCIHPSRRDRHGLLRIALACFAIEP